MSERRYPSPHIEDLRALARSERPVLSLMVPVTAAVPDAAQNPVRHERVVKRALERLRELDADAQLVERAERELAAFAGEDRAPDAGVATRAAYWSPDAGCRVFGLPFAVDETARVGSAPVLRPLARAVQRASRYRVLQLSANHVALFEGDEEGLEPKAAPELPRSLEDALGTQRTEQALQLHSTAGGGRHPVYHGQGGASRERRVDLERFHQRVARGLEATIEDDVVPLVLAADARHHPVLEGALHHDVGLLPEPLEGNAEHLSTSELHERAWPRVVAHIEALRPKQPTRRDTARPVTRLSEVVSNAAMGRIRVLWVPEEGEVPARMEEQSDQAAPAWGDDDLIESLSAEVLRRGGSVCVVSEEGEGAGAVSAELW